MEQNAPDHRGQAAHSRLGGRKRCLQVIDRIAMRLDRIRRGRLYEFVISANRGICVAQVVGPFPIAVRKIWPTKPYPTKATLTMRTTVNQFAAFQRI